MLNFIMVETQLPENLGAATRILANFGFKKLRLVRPLADINDPKAVAMSVGALDFLQVEIFDNFEDAIADLNYVFATTACPRDMVKAYETPKSFANWLASLHNSANLVGNNIGIVFGPERTGLTNDHIARCFKVITIPVQTSFSSLNLAQAMAIVAYECSQFIDSNMAAPDLRLGGTEIATQNDLTQIFKMLEPRLDASNFWRDFDKKPIMWRNLQNMFSRLPLTKQDVKTLCGLVDALYKHKD